MLTGSLLLLLLPLLYTISSEWFAFFPDLDEFDDDDDDEEDEDETEFASFVSPTAAFVVALGILPFFVDDVDDDAFEIFNWIIIGSPKIAREASMEVIIVNSALRILLLPTKYFATIEEKYSCASQLFHISWFLVRNEEMKRE